MPLIVYVTAVGITDHQALTTDFLDRPGRREAAIRHGRSGRFAENKHRTLRVFSFRSN
jgi:hypothetical protein